MTANQRRSGFRLPWVSEADEEQGEPSAAAEGEHTVPAAEGTPEPAAPTNGATPPPAPASPPVDAAPAPTVAQPDAASPPPAVGASTAPSASAEPPSEFLRDLIGAMRRVADEARAAGVTKLKEEAEAAVRAMEADAERRRQELRERAETDVAGVGEWARAEAERIKAEAEQRVAARRAQLEEQLAAEGTRTDAESKALRKRVEDYERELEAFHAQLNEISDPAAFAAAAKRMPRPPELRPRPAASPEPTGGASATAAAPTPAPAPAQAEGAEATTSPATPSGPETPTEPVHPAEEEVLSARLADLDAKLGDDGAGTDTASAPAAGAVAAEGSATTDIVVKGLGSFGAITGFRQSLSAQPGITGVALSLGQTGEFVFRATHAPGFDLAGAITTMEGDAATVEPRPEGGLRVTLERPR